MCDLRELEALRLQRDDAIDRAVALQHKIDAAIALWSEHGEIFPGKCVCLACDMIKALS